MKITQEEVVDRQTVLLIELEDDDLGPYLDRGYRRVVQRISVPGFRKGKAPRWRVEQVVGREGLINEVLDTMLPEVTDRAISEQELDAAGLPRLELVEISPFSVKATVPLVPKIDLASYTDIRIPVEPVEVTEEDVDQRLEQLRKSMAPWEPVDRAIKFGDLLNLDVQGIIGGEQAIDDHGIDFIPEQENPLPLPGFSIYMEGMTEGQEKDFTLTVPEDYPRENYAGKESRFHVNVLSVKEKQLPELDDEFAKGVRDGYESLDALKDYIRERLTEDAEAAARRQLEQDSLEEIKKIATIQASGIIYPRDLESMREDRERSVRNQRMDMDTYLSYIGQTQEEWEEKLRPQAEERLNTFLVIRKLAQEENIDITSEEVQTEIDSMITSSGESQASMRQALSTDSARESIRSSLLNRKVMERLLDIVQGRAEDSGPAESEEAIPDTPYTNEEPSPTDYNVAVQNPDDEAT